MPTSKEKKKVEATEPKRGAINHYGMGWGGALNLATDKSAPVDEKYADKAYVRVLSEFDSLTSRRGRYRPR